LKHQETRKDKQNIESEFITKQYCKPYLIELIYVLFYSFYLSLHEF